MVYREKEFNPESHRSKVGGITGTHDELGRDIQTLRLCRAIGNVTLPVLIAAEWLADTRDRRIPPSLTDFPSDERGFPSYDYIAPVLGMRHNRQGRHKTPENREAATLINSRGEVEQDILDVLNSLAYIDLWDRLPKKPEMCWSIDQILLNATIRWPTYAALYDAVKRNKFSTYGSFNKWVIEEVEMLGLGWAQEQAKGTLPGRPGKIIKPNGWGIKFVQMCEAAGFEATDDMRALSRRQQSKFSKKRDPNEPDLVTQALRNMRNLA